MRLGLLGGRSLREPTSRITHPPASPEAQAAYPHGWGRIRRVIPELDDYGRECYQQIMDMIELVLKADSPSSSA
jgi:hypothetical protein